MKANDIERPDPRSRRHSLRYRVQAPVDITVLRSGVPDTVPGRVVDLGMGGLAAVVAQEVLPGESVGVEIHLPEVRRRIRARALVRHHDKLKCGIEFVSLSNDQKTAIRKFTRKSKAPQSPGTGFEEPIALTPLDDAGSGGNSPKSNNSAKVLSPRLRPMSRGWIFLIASAMILLAVLLWRWERGWAQLETDLHSSEPALTPEAHVSADEIQKLVTHRVEPEYPEAAKAGRVQGIVAVSVVIGPDGKVASAQALNGPDFFAQSATEALRWWRFEPYRVNGRPIAVETTVAIEFKP